MRTQMALKLLCGVVFLSMGPVRTQAEESLIGRKAPRIQFEHWLNSPALDLQQLRGKTVLIRWWTAPGCRYCAATAPALNALHRKYQDRGLVVIGAYHHKSDDPLDIKEVEKHAKEFGFEFPVAIDPDWRTLRDWWLKNDSRKWTSVTFLLDKNGLIQHIHPGGEFVQGDKDFRALESAIKKILE